MPATALVDIIYVEWGARNRRSLEEAFRTVQAAGATLDQLVVADNKKECAPVQNAPARRITVVEGDNVAREFSGWDVAYGIAARDSRADVMLFVNDTLAAHRRVRLVRRWRAARWIRHIAATTAPQMFGPFAPIDLEHHQPQRWMLGTIRDFVVSYMFGMTPAAAALVFPIGVVDPVLERVMQPEYSSAGLFTEELPKMFRDRVSDWLLTPGSWRNAAPLQAENFDFFRLKAKSVLYEYALATRAVENGVAVFDVNTGRGRLDQARAALTRFWLETSSTAHYPILARINRRLLDRH